jgi:hypothetical protein
MSAHPAGSTFSLEGHEYAIVPLVPLRGHDYTITRDGHLALKTRALPATPQQFEKPAEESEPRPPKTDRAVIRAASELHKKAGEVKSADLIARVADRVRGGMSYSEAMEYALDEETGGRTPV